ncbi:hypothetical protein FDZ71_12185, partial [bacterium]
MDKEVVSKASLRRVGGYLLGRAIALAALIALAMLLAVKYRDSAKAAVFVFAAITAVSYAVTFVTAVLVHRGRNLHMLLKLQPLWDVCYIIVVVYLSGGISSPEVLFFPLAIIGSAVLYYRKGAMATASFAALSYGALSILQVYRIISPLDFLPLENLGGINIPFRIAFNIISFYGVAILSGDLAEELRRADA